MPPIDPDAPWLVNIILLLVAVALSAAVPVIVSHLSAKRRQEETQAAVAEVREQVANTHTTNLRADIDLLGESVHRIERHLEDNVRSIRALEHSIDRRYTLQSEALAGAVEDQERAIAELAGSIPGIVRGEMKKGKDRP